ncbi:MAG: hypothetical protein KC583_21140 [Myxococcales bacterium]|nr:hypothetical protein [Myxococcales bacterium]
MSACRLFFLLTCMLVTPGLAAAADPEVSIEPDEAGITFRITGPRPAKRSAVQLKVEDGGEVLVVRVKGLRTGRRWLEVDDARLNRVLQHPSHRGVWTNVRTRFTAPVAQAAADAADVRVESRTYVVRVPLNSADPTAASPVPVPVPVPVPEEPVPAPEEAVPEEAVPEEPAPEEPAPVPEEPVPVPNDPAPTPGPEDPAALLPQPAEPPPERSAFDGVWRSALAPGWGQIHNGDTARGAVYLALFGASLASGIGAGVIGRGAQDDYDDGRIDRRDDANDAYLVANVLFATAGAVWLTAVVDAALTGGSSQTVDLAPQGGAP